MSLSANQTEGGVVLQWSPPAAPAFVPTDYVLQARRNQGQWVTLSSSISANRSQLLVPGLLRVATPPPHRSLIYSRFPPHFEQDGALMWRSALSFSQDCYYELRLMSRSNELLSEPSESVNISTFGKH